MDFKDWRQFTQQPDATEENQVPRRLPGQRFADYIEEQIRAAERRGAFQNLRGMGQPLKLDANPYAGENALGYSLLKSSGYVPAEVELARDIRRELERLDIQRTALSERGDALRRRLVPPFASEKRAYNNAVNKALARYEATLHDLNRKILTLNLSAPSSMHLPLLDIAEKVSQFREACPLLP